MKNEHLNILIKILQTLCLKNKAVPKAIIFDEFLKKTKTDIEKYQFNKELSDLIHQNKIVGYKIKLGRCGGIVKNEPTIKIRITHPDGEVVGDVSCDTLQKILALIENR